MPLTNFRQIHLPYCLKKNEDGAYIVLNREYKPIGFADSSQFVKYEDYPIAVKYRISKVTAQKLSCDGSADTNAIHLYNDGCIPESSAQNMKCYLEKLAVLAKLKKIE
ncbi:MAG: hypothetical protein KBC88_06530 [Alphaproteobacteria bacterium]|jgi:hypothetical protein|nr:hypothetical protein [Alphaproteobacteria bacterium]